MIKCAYFVWLAFKFWAAVILRSLILAMLTGFHSGFQTPICLKISSGHNCTSDINSHGLSSLTKGPCLFYDECPTLHFNFRLQSFSNPSLDREPWQIHGDSYITVFCHNLSRLSRRLRGHMFFKFLKLRFWLWNFKFSGKIWKAKHWVVSKILTKAKTNVSAGSWRFPGIRKGAVGKAGKEDTCNDKDVIYNLCEDSRWKSKEIICLRYLPQQQHCVVNIESLGITVSCISLFTRCYFCWSVFHISFQSWPTEYRSLSRNGLGV